MTTTQIEELRTYLKEQIKKLNGRTGHSHAMKCAYEDILSKLPEQEEEKKETKVCGKCKGRRWIPNGVFMGNRPCECWENPYPAIP